MSQTTVQSAHWSFLLDNPGGIGMLPDSYSSSVSVGYVSAHSPIPVFVDKSSGQTMVTLDVYAVVNHACEHVHTWSISGRLLAQELTLWNVCLKR